MDHLYVIDDDPRFLELMRVLLKPNQVEAFAAARAAMAQMTGGGGLPDIIFLDVLMPDVDGPTFLDFLQTDPAFARIPVVLVSATEALSAIYGKDKRVAACLQKPFDPKQLPALIKRLTGKTA